MRIDVLFFAALKEIFGERRLVDVPPGGTVSDVMELLMQQVSGWSGQFPLVFAVNEDFAAVDRVLREGDRLAIMTPMSGG